MATTNKNKLTTFKSGQTIVTSDFMNSFYQAPNGETASGNEAYGHIHDGARLDGHAQKINLADHVDGLLDPEKIDGNILSQISLSASGTGTLTGDSSVDPDGPTGSVSFVAGNGIEIEADAATRTITFKTEAEAITYTLSSTTVAGGAGIRLTSGGVDQDVLIKQGSNVSVARNLAGEIVIAAANTTYSVSGQTIAGGALIRLTSSTAVNDDLKLESGTNVTVERISADVIRVSAQVPTVPLTTKGDILARDNAGNVRLPVGTNGQVLSANSGTATGLQWVNSLTLPTTTAGDLVVHNGTTNVRLPVGSNGQYLKVNTALPARVEWSNAQGGLGDVVGPATSTDNAIARYNLGTGKSIQNSLVTIDDEGTLTGTIVRVGDDNAAGNVIVGDGTATTWAMVTARGPNASYRGMRIDNNTTEIWFAGSPNDSSGNYVLRSGGATNVVTVTSAGNMTITGDLTVSGNDIKSSSATAITLSGADVSVAGDLTVGGNDIKSSSATAITLSGADASISGDLTVTGGDIKSSSGTALTLSGSDVSVAGDLTISGNDIKTSTGTAITLSGSNVNVLGTLTSQSKFNYQTTLFAPQTMRHTTSASLQGALDSGVGRYFVAFSDDQEALWNIAIAAPGASQVGRVITISNVGLGKINMATNGEFFIPFVLNPTLTMQLIAGEWVEFIATTASRWLVVCGGTATNYLSPP